MTDPVQQPAQPAAPAPAPAPQQHAAQPMAPASRPASAPAKPSRLPIVALVLAIVALGVGLSALALSGVGGTASAGGRCDATTLWEAYPAAASLPAGWRYEDLDAGDTGLSGTLQDAASTDTFPPSVYFWIMCPEPGAAAVLAATKELADVAGSDDEIGFRKVGDEAYATKDGDGNISVTFRAGDALVRVYSFSSDVPLSVYEDLAGAIEQALGGSGEGSP